VNSLPNSFAQSEPALAFRPAASAAHAPKPTAPPTDEKRVLVLGLGNDILTDDAVGLNVVRQVRDRLADHPAVEVRETMEMGLALLDFLVGFREVILVDSIQTPGTPPGTIHELDASALKQLTGRTPHFLGVGETLALGQKLGLSMPREVKIFAIEVGDPYTLGEQMTPALENAVPAVVERVMRAVQAFLNPKTAA
jgi:hydrogenase maturation protease